MTFYTGVETPKCNRLKSTMQKATERYDRNALRNLHLNNTPSTPRRAKRVRAGQAPPPLPATPGPPGPPAPHNALQSDVKTVPARGYFGSPESAAQGRLTTLPVTNVTYSNPDLGDVQGGRKSLQWGPEQHYTTLNPPSATTAAFDESNASIPIVSSETSSVDAVSVAASPPNYRAKRPMKTWLAKTSHLNRQAEGHVTHTYALRKVSAAQNKLTSERSKQTRKVTNTELRSKVRDVQRVKTRVEDALNAAVKECEVMGQVRQFLVEIKNMIEAGSLAGSEMRLALRDSRPASERVDDAPEKCLTIEHRHHRHAVNCLAGFVRDSSAHLEAMQDAVSDLYSDLEEKVEGLRIDEQCLVLDGSSSVNPQMGGTAADQPPLELMLDCKAKEVIQGLDTGVAFVPTTRATTLTLIEKSTGYVTKALSLRREWKKAVCNLDMVGRRLNKKVDEALKARVAVHSKVVASLTARVGSILEERCRLEAQMEVVSKELQDKNREKDIVCKRLRLRCQIPGRDVDDKVHEALEEEYDFLTLAVQDFTSKLSHITLEISRMHDTKKSLEADLSVKRAGLNLDLQCLALPFSHTLAWPTHLYNGICSGHCAVYGCAPTEPPATERRQKRSLVKQLQQKEELGG